MRTSIGDFLDLLLLQSARKTTQNKNSPFLYFGPKASLLPLSPLPFSQAAAHSGLACLLPPFSAPAQAEGLGRPLPSPLRSGRRPSSRPARSLTATTGPQVSPVFFLPPWSTQTLLESESASIPCSRVACAPRWHRHK